MFFYFFRVRYFLQRQKKSKEVSSFETFGVYFRLEAADSKPNEENEAVSRVKNFCRLEEESGKLQEK